MPESCCSCEDIKKVIHDTVSELFDKRVEELKTTMQTPSKTRAKRAPSKYNIFMGECVKKGGDFRKCAGKWKQCKTEGTNPCHS